MPRPGEVSITVRAEIAREFSRLAESLGYGPHGRQKLMEVALEVIEAHPSLFRRPP